MNIEFVNSEISGFYAYMLSCDKLRALRLSENDDAFLNIEDNFEGNLLT